MSTGMRRPTEAERSIRRHTRKRVAFGANTVAAVALAAVLAAMVNYLAHRHYVRADWSRAQFYGLSDKTHQLLAGLSNDVDVVVFFQPDDPNYEDVNTLLKEYALASPHIRLDRVDPNRDIARAEELARRYQVNQLNVVVFACEGRTKFVGAEDLADLDYSGVMRGEAPQATSFKGEQAFSSALQSITQSRPPVVYFLRGHGERDINDRDPYSGYSALAQQIRRDNAVVKDLALGEAHGIPDDADAIVVPGPTKTLATQEIEALRAWLDDSGRLMVLLDTGSPAGLLPLLDAWSIRLDNDVVVDPTRTLSGLDLFVDDYGQHAITRNLRSVTSVFYLPRSVEPVTAAAGAPRLADQPQVTSIARSSPDSWAESDLEQKPMKFEAARDRKGPVSIAVAAERGPVAGVDVDIRPSRLVVFGDTDFLSNGALSGGNVDLFLSALNWLLERDQLMAIAPKPIEDTRLVITQAQVNRLFWLVVVVLPGLVGILGAAVWLRRRS